MDKGYLAALALILSLLGTAAFAAPAAFASGSILTLGAHG